MINVSDSGTTSSSNDVNYEIIGKVAAEAVQKELIDQKRPGGILSKSGVA